jgi:hypothetical protein
MLKDADWEAYVERSKQRNELRRQGVSVWLQVAHLRRLFCRKQLAIELTCLPAAAC